MSSVIMTLGLSGSGLSDHARSEGAISEGMVTRLE
jgi:hypothetical protein